MMTRFLVVFMLLFFSRCSSTEEKWTYLFNGIDLSNWDTYLGKPNPQYGLYGYERDSAGNYYEPLGLNDDPFKVFSVFNMGGISVLNISGKIWGALTTKEEYDNFHLSLEYYWGERRWPPRDSSKRDSGILYFCVGEHGAGSDAWMQSQECQIQEGDTGDYWSVAGAIADIPAVRIPFENERVFQFKQGAPLQTIGDSFDGVHWNQLRCLKSENNEKPRGEWNRVEVYAYNGNAIHVVNGKVVMALENSRRLVDGKEVPLTKGKIQLQSEGAEIFFREIKIRKISRIPDNI
jgi:hypothetical protein